LAADVVGYSALMQRAEEATHAEFERLKRELIPRKRQEHRCAADIRTAVINSSDWQR
jgi:hypothetical protein